MPAPAHVIEWMRAFADEHYVVEPKRRKRLRKAKLIDKVDEPRLKVLVPYL